MLGSVRGAARKGRSYRDQAMDLTPLRGSSLVTCLRDRVTTATGGHHFDGAYQIGSKWQVKWRRNSGWKVMRWPVISSRSRHTCSMTSMR